MTFFPVGVLEFQSGRTAILYGLTSVVDGNVKVDIPIPMPRRGKSDGKPAK